MDDLKLFYGVVTDDDFDKMPNDINNIQNWCSRYEMKTNFEKCPVISFSRKKFPMTHNYKLSNNQLNRVVTIKGLGIIFDTTLNFHEH